MLAKADVHNICCMSQCRAGIALPRARALSSACALYSIMNSAYAQVLAANERSTTKASVVRHADASFAWRGWCGAGARGLLTTKSLSHMIGDEARCLRLQLSLGLAFDIIVINTMYFQKLGCSVLLAHKQELCKTPDMHVWLWVHGTKRGAMCANL